MFKPLLLLILSCVFFSSFSFSQINGVTEKGDEVVLFENGTWKYKNDDKPKSWTTSLDTLKFKKSSLSTFLVKGERVSYGIWIDPKKWKFKKKTEKQESSSEFTFSLVNSDAYGMVIAEGIEIPVNELKELALQNAIKAAPDAKVVYEDVRNINGLNIHCLQIDGTVQGIKFTYLGYYYSSEKGSVQFVTFTSQSLLKKYKAEMEGLLNGFVML